MRSALLALAALLAGCATYHAYDGPPLPRSQVAIVTGSAKIRSALPLALVIRAVDGREVGLQYASVALSPGRHELLVDCQVTGETGTASRHVLSVEVAAGERYRLNALMAPGNRACSGVELETS
jgi:hypothetical protein